MKISRVLTHVSLDGLSVALARIFSILCSLAIMALAARRFSPEQFGLWALMTPIVSIVLSFDFGLSSAVRNKLVGAAPGDAQALFQSATFFLAGVTVFFIALSAVLWSLHVYGLIFATQDAQIRSTASLLIFLSTAIVFFRLPLYLALNAFFSYRESKLNAAFDGLNWLAMLAAAVIVFNSPAGLIPAAVTYQIAGVAAALAAFIAFIRRRRWTMKWPRDGFDHVRRLLKSSLPFALLQLFSMIANYASIFAVAAVVSIQDIGPYRGAMSICTAIMALFLAYMMPLWTEFTHIVVSGRYRALPRQLGKSLAQTALILVPLAAFVVLGPWIIRTWLHLPFDNRNLLVELAATTLCQALANTISLMFNGAGRPELNLYSLMPGAILCVPLALILGQRYGVNGVALSFLISSAITLALICIIAFVWWRAWSESSVATSMTAR